METSVYLPASAPSRKPSSIRSLSVIFFEICNYCDVFPEELGYRDRRPHVVRARNEFYYRVLTETTHSIQFVARYMGSDHSSVMYGVCRHALAFNLPLPRGDYRCTLKQIARLKGARGTVYAKEKPQPFAGAAANLKRVGLITDPANIATVYEKSMSDQRLSGPHTKTEDAPPALCVD